MKYLKIILFYSIISNMENETSLSNETQKSKLMCWSCGRMFLPEYKGEYCPDCGGRIIEIRKPKNIPPTCGSPKSIQFFSNPNERVPRPCCICGNFFLATKDEWIHGTCPHCGARGPTGDKGKSPPAKDTYERMEGFSKIPKKDF